MKKVLIWLMFAIPFAAFAQTPQIHMSATSPHSVILTCSAGAGTSPTGFNFFRGTTAGGESSTPLNTAPVSTCAYTDTAVTAATTYYYTATEIVGGVSSGPSNEVSGQITVFPPTGVSLSINGSVGTVSWSPSSDASSAYNVYVGTAPGAESATASNSSPVDAGCTNSSSCTYQLTGLTAGNTYYVTVKAVINGVLSTATAEVSGTVTVPPPTNLKMTVN